MPRVQVMAAGLESQRMQQQQQQQAGKGRGGRLLPKSLFSQASCWLPHCHTHTCSPQNTKAADATTARELPTPRKATASSDDAEGVASGRTTAQLPARKKHGTRVLRNVYPPPPNIAYLTRSGWIDASYRWVSHCVCGFCVGVQPSALLFR